MPLISSKRVWTRQPQTRQQLNPLFSDRLIALVVPGQPEYFGGGLPVISGVGKIVPARAGIAAKAVYNGAGANEVRWPVDLSFSGDYTFSVFSSNEDQIADLPTFYTSGNNLNNITHGNAGSSALVDNNLSTTITTTASYTPRLISARRRSNQCSVVVDKTASSENITGTRDQVWTALNVGRDGASNSVGTTNYLIAVWSRYVSNEVLFALSENPWQLFEKQDRRIWIPSAGGGGITITGAPGNATTAGITAGISSATTIACAPGGASTAGVACALPIKIACNVGNATPTGIACSLQVVVQCNAGTATTAGVSASISLDSSITISCNAGTATTSGVSASFPQTLSCTPGNATTAGVTAGIAGATTISCNVGNVSVAGITAGISSAITISCNAGTATTSGIAASFPQTLSCNVGNATTAGITAQVDIAGQIVIGCNAGTATTAGASANISSAFVLACNPSNATTLGATAYFPQSLQCSPGNAITLGVNATFTVAGPTTIVCNAGNAYAAGVHCDFGSRFDTPPDAIVTVTNKRNRVSVISRRS